MVTVFTPTYNRAHLLPRLFDSLQGQTCFDFEWLIVDDGSTDDTEAVVQAWIASKPRFSIRYYKVENGGKMRAINYGLSVAKGEYFCGIDSDDWFASNTIELLINTFLTISPEEGFIGVCMIKGDSSGKVLNCEPSFSENQDYIDCTNIECEQHGLQGDMTKVFFTHLQRKYEIPVWEGEKFTPESVFLDKMAIDGWKMRWLNAVTTFCEYQEEGLTDSSWQLLRKNPMGYAMMFNMQLIYQKGLIQRINTILQFISCCCLKREYTYILKCNSRIGALILFIPGYLLSLRRKRQFEKYCR